MPPLRIPLGSEGLSSMVHVDEDAKSACGWLPCRPQWQMGLMAAAVACCSLRARHLVPFGSPCFSTTPYRRTQWFTGRWYACGPEACSGWRVGVETAFTELHRSPSLTFWLKVNLRDIFSFDLHPATGFSFLGFRTPTTFSEMPTTFFEILRALFFICGAADEGLMKASCFVAFLLMKALLLSAKNQHLGLR